MNLADKQKTEIILSKLEKAYPEAHCELNFGSNFELLTAVILSAQCTDKRVNEVTKKLFLIASTPEKFALMDYETLEKLIYSCGFYRNKARSIINMSRDLLAHYDGKVPETFDELIKLSGVGRKTANVMLSVAFGKQAIAVDTHVYRVSRRLGFSDEKTPHGVEKDLTALIDEALLSRAHHLLIFHGRYCCHSKRPDCVGCPVNGECPSCYKA